MKDTRLLLTHINAHQKMASAEKFNNQVDMKFNNQVHILWTVRVFLQPHLSLPNGTMNKVAMLTEKHRLNHMDFYSSRLPWVYLLFSARYIPTAETNTETLYSTIPWASKLMTGWTYWTTFFVDRTMLFLHIMLLPKLPSVDIETALSTVMVFYTELSRNSLHSQKSVTCSWNPLVLSCSLRSWSRHPHKMMEWPFKDTVTAPIKWHSPEGLEEHSPEVCFEPVFNIQYSFSYSQDSLGKFLLPVPTASSAGSGSFGSSGSVVV